MRPDKRAKTDWAALTHERRMDDWSDGVGEAGVFVPGLMGAGIILSAALLASDGVRRLLPKIGGEAQGQRGKRRASHRAFHCVRCWP